MIYYSLSYYKSFIFMDESIDPYVIKGHKPKLSPSFTIPTLIYTLALRRLYEDLFEQVLYNRRYVLCN